jgi:hypothetical protein
MVRWGLAGVVVLVCTLLAVTLHLRARGQEAVAECDKALAAGDAHMAITWARDAAMSVAPLSPYPEQGYARLTTMADRAEERGDFGEATAAWRAVGVAVHATRSEGSEAARLEAADGALVRLAAKTCQENQSRPPAVCAAAAQAALDERHLPPLSRFDWLAVGAVAFLGCGAWAAQATGRRVRLASLAVALFGVAVATVALVTR